MSDTHDEPGPFRDDLRSQLVAAGTAAAEQWLSDRANRKMSDVSRRRLAGHVVSTLWFEIEHAAVEMAQYIGEEQVAAMTARAEKAEAEVTRLKSVDPSGWSAEENAEFEQRYGVEAAMRLQAANNRIWAIVQELRQTAVAAGRDPYQDPMAQRLSAALVGVDQQAQMPDQNGTAEVGQ